MPPSIHRQTFFTMSGSYRPEVITFRGIKCSEPFSGCTVPELPFLQAFRHLCMSDVSGACSRGVLSWKVVLFVTVNAAGLDQRLNRTVVCDFGAAHCSVNITGLNRMHLSNHRDNSVFKFHHAPLKPAGITVSGVSIVVMPRSPGLAQRPFNF